MNVPQIRLQSTSAALSILTTPGRMDIKQPPAELDIQQPGAKMGIERTPPKLTIDQTEARADMDLKSVRRRIEEYSQQGYEDWLTGLARVAQDGDELMMIENGGGAIASQAKRNSEDPMYEFNIGWIPSAGSVKISYNPGNVKINVEPQKVVNHSRPQNPNIQYTAAQVDVSLKRYADLQIDFANLKHVGFNYEQEI
ncbi:hypothetical protein FHE72_20925 [Rossellomorea vietnamensis]|uniref:Uncharacterized protein n=1 Tax=Rossellomorea vietnamensis TaxID=218284 RepID=A0A6I6UUC5_9BACI|nr:DUF6470 family protein [Rossellomorea vietnamensis]QHE63201.1 hypothetical protein FHE72_20925 [Rossellomorea vietnamensis]